MKGEHLRWKLWRNLVKRCLVNLYKSTKSIKTNGFNNRSSLYFHHMFQPPPARRRQELRAEIQELHRSLAEAEARYAQMERENTNAPAAEVTWSNWERGQGQGQWVGWVKSGSTDFYHGILGPNSFRQATWHAVPKAESFAPATGALGCLQQSALSS